MLINLTFLANVAVLTHSAPLRILISKRILYFFMTDILFMI